MRVLVCGGREWSDTGLVAAVLTGLYAERSTGHLTVEMFEFVLIEGGARGADAAAAGWAENSPMHSYNEGPDDPAFSHERYPADWDKYGKAAGPIRNKAMLATGVDLVIAFHDKIEESKGTKHMVAIAKEAGVPVWLVSHH